MEFPRRCFSRAAAIHGAKRSNQAIAEQAAWNAFDFPEIQKP
jgi:hypothetical protein